MEDKQKQIEEMAKCACGNYNNGGCEIDGFVCNYRCSYYEECEKLYNAGYRKADDLLKELQSMKSDFAKDMLEIKETYEKEVVDLVNEVRKETAEKFARKAKEQFADSVRLCEQIDGIAKEFTEGKNGN